MRRSLPTARRFAPAGVILAAAALVLPCGARAAGMTATVRGEVNRPGTFAVEAGERLSTLVERAEGFTDAAFPRGAVLTRKAAAESQERELREIVRRIGTEADAGGSPGEREASQRFLAALRGLHAAGRVPVRLAHPRLMKGTADDLPVEDGDVLTVPPAGGPVAVAGAVHSQGSYPLRAGAGYREYIRDAGGRREDADAKKTWLLAADGTAVPLARPFVAWDDKRARWEFTAFPGDAAAPGAGDTIVVPRRTDRDGWLMGVRDVDRLVVRIAILTGTVVLP